jgi:putative DNA primase/helicase
MTDAATISQALGGKSTSIGFMCRCPVISHGNGKGDRNPSLLVKDGDSAPLLKCFAGCDVRDVLAELRSRGLMEGAGATLCTRKAPEQAPQHIPDQEAIALWGSATRASSTIVERYLRARGITIEVPPSLRCGGGDYLDRYQLPAMVAAVQAPDRRTIAVQTTLIDPRGDRKAQVRLPRKTTGALGLGAVRLGPAADVMGLAEGVETGLSAMQVTGIPVWACLGSFRMCRVSVPGTVREVHLFGDNDDPGREAVQRAAHAHRHRRVVVHFPPDQFPDWNDVVATGRDAA